MSKSTIFRFLVFLLPGAALLLTPGTPFATGRRPDIVLIVIDTLRADHLPAYGYPPDNVPFLKWLGEQSTVFEEAHSAAASTGPATASIFTSTYPFQHHVLSNSPDLVTLDEDGEMMRLNRIPSRTPTIATYLKRQGYRTFGISDNATICAKTGFTRGFDRFATFPYKGAEKISAEIVSWLEDMRGSRPYFLYIHFMDPHNPYHRRAPWFQETGDDHKNRIAAYDSEIAYLDDRLRSLFYTFKWQDNTLVILTADHGEEFMEHGNWGHEKNLYDTVLHVPLMFYYPDMLPKGKKVAASVSTMDIFPTVADMIAAPENPTAEGMSLTRYFRGDETAAPPRFIYGYQIYKGSTKRPRPPRVYQSVIYQSWKYIQTRRSRELYDLADDPGERSSLVQRHPRLASALRNALQAFLKECRQQKAEYSPVTRGRGDNLVDELKSLGYLQ